MRLAQSHSSLEEASGPSDEVNLLRRSADDNNISQTAMCHMLHGTAGTVLKHIMRSACDDQHVCSFIFVEARASIQAMRMHEYIP